MSVPDGKKVNSRSLRKVVKGAVAISLEAFGNKSPAAAARVAAELIKGAYEQAALGKHDLYEALQASAPVPKSSGPSAVE